MPRPYTRQRGEEEIDVEDVARDPRPGMYAPNQLSWASDDRHIASLLAEPGAIAPQLIAWALDADGRMAPARPSVQPDFSFAGPESPAFETRMRRERPRSWTDGIKCYSWGQAPGSNTIIFQANGSVYIQDGVGAEPELIVDAQTHHAGLAGGPILEPKLSPNEQLLAFVRGAEVHVLSLAARRGGAAAGSGSGAAGAAGAREGEAHGGSGMTAVMGAHRADAMPISPPLSHERSADAMRDSPSPFLLGVLPHGEPPWRVGVVPIQRSIGASPGAAMHGHIEFRAAEELERYDGYWWSTDSMWIAFQETDESSVPPFVIPRPCGELDDDKLAESIRYPFAGGNNAIVRVGVLAARGGADAPLWLDLGIEWERRPTPAAALSGDAAPLTDDAPGADTAPRADSAAGGARGSRKARSMEPTIPYAQPRKRPVQFTTQRDERSADRPAKKASHPPQPALGNYGSTGYARFHDGYLLSVDWGCRGELYVQVEDRTQRVLRLLRFAAPGAGGAWHVPQMSMPPLVGTVVIEERSTSWVDLQTCMRELSDGGVLWVSARSGFRHLYRYSAVGACEGALTAGEWVVDTIAAVDERANLVFLTASLGDVSQRNLFSAPLRARHGQPRACSPSELPDDALMGGPLPSPLPASVATSAPPSLEEPTRLTREAGWHEVEISHDKTRFVDVFTAVGKPYCVTVRRLSDGELLAVLYQTQDPRASRLPLPDPELDTVRSAQGDVLNAVIYYPPARFARPWPLLVSCYGGPGKQITANSWALNAAMREQYYAQEGYLVMRLDNRGSARRGMAFAQALRGQLGNAEVCDQVAGVKRLIERGLADANRVGVVGWSYGGYLALLCLAQAPDVFHAACCGAPLTFWTGYSTHYTERYLGLPDTNAQGYRSSSALSHVPKIRTSASLMLVHGLLDENVHFRHTAVLIKRLTQCRKTHELLVFPREGHILSEHEQRIYMEERMAEFFHVAIGAGRAAGRASASGSPAVGDKDPGRGGGGEAVGLSGRRTRKGR